MVTTLTQWLALATLCAATDGQLAPPRNGPSLQPQTVQFRQSAPYASAAELTRRLGPFGTLPEYDIAKESFQAVVPGSYSTNESWGLFVWISPGADPRIKPGWAEELAQQRLVFISATNAGNERHPIDRCRLALDATCNMSRLYKLDPARLYIAGFSGGGRMASILGVAYADLFTGCVSICGADFYQNVAGAAGKYFPGTYRPAPSLVLRAKQHCRFALLTGETDFNRENTWHIAENGFKRQGFRNVRYLEVAGMGHAMPSAAVLHTALQYVDGTNSAALR